MATLPWFLKAMFVMLTPSFHAKLNFERTKNYLFMQFVINTLSGLALSRWDGGLEVAVQVEDGTTVDISSGCIIGIGESIKLSVLDKFNKMNISSRRMKRLIRMVQFSGFCCSKQSIFIHVTG